MPTRLTVILFTLFAATACSTTKDEQFFYHPHYGMVGSNQDHFRRDAHRCAEYVSQRQSDQQQSHDELNADELNALTVALDIKVALALPEAGAVAAQILNHLNQVGNCLKANGWSLLPPSI